MFIAQLRDDLPDAAGNCLWFAYGRAATICFVPIYRRQGPEAAERFLTEYAPQCTTKVGRAYDELVDYLMTQYLVGYGEISAPRLPRVAAPVVP